MNILPILFSLTLFTSPSVQPTDPKSDWKTLLAEGHSIQHPAAWTEDVSGNIGSTFFLYSPLTDEEDTFSENINLMVQPLQGLGMTLEKFVQTTEDQVGVFMTESKIIHKDYSKKSKKECCVLEYAGLMNGFELHFLQYLWVIDEKAYILTFTAEGKNFEKYRLTATEILDSMKLKN
jgi:hypothetical protein